jgi:hypothetical protein
VTNLQLSMEPSTPEAKAALLAGTRLAAKDKDPIVAQDVLFVERNSAFGSAEARFLLPRSVVLTPEDKQAEFTTKFGKVSVKARFYFREMVVRGMLEL